MIINELKHLFLCLLLNVFYYKILRLAYFYILVFIVPLGDFEGICVCVGGGG